MGKSENYELSKHGQLYYIVGIQLRVKNKFISLQHNSFKTQIRDTDENLTKSAPCSVQMWPLGLIYINGK